MFREDRKHNSCRSSSGIALILTIVVLVALSAVIYRLGSYLADYRHRQQYIIDYQKARYGCESALKYALSMASEIELEFVGRPNEPDFSDLFSLNEDEYSELISEWAVKLGIAVDSNNIIISSNILLLI